MMPRANLVKRTSFSPRTARLAGAVVFLSSALASAADPPPSSAGPSLGAPDAADAAKMCSIEEGQRLRAAGKLHEAGTFFLTCRESCALELHRECERNAQDTFAAMPTLMVKATDSRGGVITDASVTIDGKPAGSELDGKAFAVDPGPHVVAVTRKGVTLTQSIVATEGSKNMPVKVMFKGHDPDAMARDLGGHTIWPWAVTGLGVATVIAGIAVVATAPSLPAGCDKETKVCQPQAGETATSTSFEQRRDEAGKAKDQPAVGGVIIGLGAAIAIGGVVWHFVEPTEPRTGKAPARKLTPSPWLAKDSGGVGLSGSF